MLSSVCHSCLKSCFDPRKDSFLLHASSLTFRCCGIMAPGRSFACACGWCSPRFQWIAVKTISYSSPCQMSLDCRTLQHDCQPLSLCLTSKVVTVTSPPRSHYEMTQTYVTSLLTATVPVTLTLTLIQNLMMMRNQSLTSPSNFIPFSVVISSLLNSAFSEWLASSPIFYLSRGSLHTSWRLRATATYSVAGRRGPWSWSSKWKIGTRTLSLTFVYHVWAYLLPVLSSILSWKERGVKVGLRTRRDVVWKE